MIAFRVNGKPKAQPRMKAARHGRYTSLYDPGTAEDWKMLVSLAAKAHLPEVPLACALKVDIDFYFPRPKRLCRRKDPTDRIPHTAKPDRDNCEKAVLDLLTQMGMWLDDCQVCAGEVRKWYHRVGGKPGMHIWIDTVDPTLGAAEATLGVAK